MARDPSPDHGCELAGLKTEATVFPRRDADGVFVKAQSRARIAWVETTIDPHLGKDINRRADLRVGEQREPRD